MNVEEIITTATRMLSAQTPSAPISSVGYAGDGLACTGIVCSGAPNLFFLEKLPVVLLTILLEKIG